MVLPHSAVRYTPKEYYELERQSHDRNDYYQGRIFSTAGGTSDHSSIIVNILGETRQRMKSREVKSGLLAGCHQRLCVSATGLRCYPDASIYGDEIQYDPEDEDGETAINPIVIMEVLSQKFEAYERGLKAWNYRRIPSLKAYLLVSQNEARVEMFARLDSGRWLLSDHDGIDAIVDLPMFGISLPLMEVYDRVELAQAH